MKPALTLVSAAAVLEKTVAPTIAALKIERLNSIWLRPLLLNIDSSAEHSPVTANPLMRSNPHATQGGGFATQAAMAPCGL